MDSATRRKYVLFVNGASSVSREAEATLRKLCSTHLLPDSYEIEVVDLRDYPQLARPFRLVSTPLVSWMDSDKLRSVGDLSNEQQAIRSLGLDRRQ